MPRLLPSIAAAINTAQHSTAPSSTTPPSTTHILFLQRIHILGHHLATQPQRFQILEDV
jgi:hypothetical protein